MSYGVSIYNKEIVPFLRDGLELDEFKIPPIPDDRLDKFKKRLTGYGYKLLNNSDKHSEYTHKNPDFN